MDNDKYDVIFPDVTDKAAAFDKLAEMFYSKNFSSTSKSEIELMMFSIYMDATIKSIVNNDGSIDYNACSDYVMGKELGVTQEKIRILKVKKQARYPVDFNWQISLLNLKDSVRYERENNRIVIPTRDPVLYNEIRNYIEEHGGYIEIQRSGNVIQIRPEYYFMLMYETTSEREQNACRKKIAKELNEKNKENNVPEPKTAKDVLKSVVKLAEFVGVDSFAKVYPDPNNILLKVFISALDNCVK